MLTTKNGFKTIFLLKVLPHSDKVRFDFFHLEKTYIQDTHTPTREEGRQVNVFSDHAADFTSIKRFNTASGRSQIGHCLVVEEPWEERSLSRFVLYSAE